MFFEEATAPAGEVQFVDVQSVVDKVIDWVMSVGVRLVIAFIIMFVSFKVINLISRRIERRANDARADKTIMKTLAYLTKIGLKVLVVICLVGYVGIDTSGLTALVVSFGACIGLAVNGALSNLAGGVLIILTRPFKLDDYIEAQGYSGTVVDIHITTTKLRTPDNKVIYIPNGPLATGNIVNYSVMDTRRVDFTFSVAYGSDVEQAKKIIREIIEGHELVLKDPEVFVRLTNQGDSALDITARAWVKSGDYWTVNFDVIEAVTDRFEKEGIEIPFNQLDVRVRQD
ncbi:MAG: mechanosensitive ion channel [Clostridia bacterium]|nr:mechanosensitive ion channel [Clostridia bacterium]